MLHTTWKRRFMRFLKLRPVELLHIFFILHLVSISAMVYYGREDHIFKALNYISDHWRYLIGLLVWYGTK